MATRKGKGRQAVRNNSGGLPSWAGLLVGILIGALVVVVLLRHSLVPMSAKPGPHPNPQATAQQDSDTGLQPSSSTPQKPKYDFYSVLSEKEVRIPDAELSAQARAEQQKQQAAAQASPTTTAAPSAAPAGTPGVTSQNVTAAPQASVQASSGSGYLLQVGAFPNPADAETLKAKLALQGFVANVRTVNVGGQTYHRVRLGPFQSAMALEAVKQRLAKAGIPAIALKEGH
ncbi:SPOR domain-containing protein [Dyella sp. A6]|uniref:SPOR domain-containing protein n=1 Tax=Dyella aluminiiresistens TaxID=3069105 RepID=UPI002E7A813B|nr:SPOR domain-containing protein [Dyella sp. A6]